MNKFNFIKQLLENKAINFQQREKVFELISRDYVSSDVELKRVWEEINDIRKNINLIKNKGEVVGDKKITKDSGLKKSSIRLKKHSPKQMIFSLFEFSKNDNLKWFTHPIDLVSNKIDILSKLNDFVNWKFPSNINLATSSFVKSFLLENKKDKKHQLSIFHPRFETDLTYSNEIILGELKKGTHPFDIKIQDVYFADIINRFKCAIEFRLDKENFNFYNLFTKLISDKIAVDFIEEYTEDFKKNARVLTTYIDVNNFFKGIELIMTWLNDYKAFSNKLIIDLIEEEDYYLLTIFHKGSKILHDFESPKLEGVAGNMDLLRKYWFSIVDLEIQADFNENTKAFKIICLDSKTNLTISPGSSEISKNTITDLPNSIGGVKYLIKIYKTKNL